MPPHNLVGFQRIHLAAGESQEVRFTITPEMLMLYDHSGQQMLEPGQFRLVVGGCSPSSRGLVLGAPEPLRADFSLLAA